MASKLLPKLSPAILTFAERTRRSLNIWMLVLAMGLMALPVQGQLRLKSHAGPGPKTVPWVGGYAQVKGLVLFGANDPNNGRELWRTDGTQGGTSLVLDIAPGPTSSSSPVEMTAVNDLIFFSATDRGSAGRELWQFNPADGVTTQVADIYGNGLSSSPRFLTALKGSLFFSAESGTGIELWIHNPANGVTQAIDIYPGVESSSPTQFAVMNDILYFSADDGNTGAELWKHNPETGETGRIADINAGMKASNPYNLTVVGNVFFFSANDGNTGSELWIHNPETGMTGRVADVNPGPNSSDLAELTAVNNAIFFSASDGQTGLELWKHDLATGETGRVIDLQPGSLPSVPTNLTAAKVGDKEILFFSAENGISGFELWKHDPATGETTETDINPGEGSSSPLQMTAVKVGDKDVLYFTASDGSTGRELWKHNPETGETTRIIDIMPGTDVPPFGTPDGPTQMAVVRIEDRRKEKDVLYFSANDGNAGRELWKHDPTTGTTALIADIYPGTASSLPTGQ